MLLRDILTKQGDRLFRYRGYAPFILVPVWLMALQNSEWIELRFGDLVDDIYDWLCFGISLVGLALRVATIGHVQRRTSGRNTGKGQVADELNTTGLYSVVRNPLYLANGFILAGFLLATGSFWFTVAGLLACCIHYERVVCAEEEFLARRFGERFLAWAEKTPPFLPRLSLWVPPVRRFCLRTAVKREYLTTFGLIVAFTLTDYLEDLLSQGRLRLESETTVLCLCALLMFLTIRYLRRNTRLLHVEGR